MANKVLNMLQVRRILQLLEEGRSKRYIHRELDISRNTIDTYERRFKLSGLTLSQLLQLRDVDFSKFIYPSTSIALQDNSRAGYFDSQVDYFVKELKRVGVTRRLLWQEYIQGQNEVYSYSQFCERLNQQTSQRNVVMHLEHLAGDKLQVDFAGKTFSITNPDTGIKTEHPVLICVLPFSGLTYIQVLENAKIYFLYTALAKCLRYIGGVPRSILSDNMRQYVTKSDRYEPTFNEAAEEFSVYYNTGLLSTRPACPRDKPNVERQVSVTYQRIYAPLRNREFFSLETANFAFLECLESHNNIPKQKTGESRREQFERDERSELKLLPDHDFVFRHRTQAKVNANYHVLLGEDRHHYSVPYIHVGKKVVIIYDTIEVEIFLDMQRIALHPRSSRKQGYSTIPDHMPQNHQKYKQALGWDADYFLYQGTKIGPKSSELMERLLNRSRIPEQNYAACRGILSLGKKYGNSRLEAACGMAVTLSATTYSIVANILKNSRDLQETKPEENNPQTPNHPNIRGKEAFQ